MINPDDEAKDKVLEFAQDERDRADLAHFTHGSEHQEESDHNCSACAENAGEYSPRKFHGAYSDITEAVLNTPGPDDDERSVSTRSSGGRKDYV